MSRRPVRPFLVFVLVLTCGACCAEAPKNVVPKDAASQEAVEVSPDALMVTFFPVPLLTAFAGVTENQAAQIRAIETKLDADRSTAKDDDQKHEFRRQADSDIRKLLLPAQIDTLSRCAFKLQILTNTFGFGKLSKITFTPAEAAQMRPALATAYTEFMQAGRERDLEASAAKGQLSSDAAAEQTQMDLIAQHRETKIKAMRAQLKASTLPLLTDAQKAILGY